jgi:hypothetical protein
MDVGDLLMAFASRGSGVKRRTSIAIAVSCMVAAAITAVALHERGARASATAAVGRDPAVEQAAFGVYLRTLPPVSGHPLQLPDGRAAMTASAAESVAMAHTGGAVAGRLRDGVSMTAELGLFSDDQYATRLPSGALQPHFQNVPAWLVTFGGPGLVLPNSGPRGGQPLVNHQETIVLNAATGEFLESYTHK